ncbi:LPD38 domain-containing protein [Salinisphaera sp. SPP-AMP-43]|uniref:LPD38 domain-containing protein n=1 Tax=Salinisphaera sp. SPP-AMP-43 TaxID=3121288 RepID=UPI003C6E38EE
MGRNLFADSGDTVSSPAAKPRKGRNLFAGDTADRAFGLGATGPKRTPFLQSDAASPEMQTIARDGARDPEQATFTNVEPADPDPARALDHSIAENKDSMDALDGDQMIGEAYGAGAGQSDPAAADAPNRSDLPDPSRPRDSFLESVWKGIQNVPAQLESSAIGMMRGAAESGASAPSEAGAAPAGAGIMSANDPSLMIAHDARAKALGLSKDEEKQQREDIAKAANDQKLVGDVATHLQDKLTREIEANQPNVPKYSAANLGYMISNSAGQMAPTIAAGAINPALGATQMFTQVAGQQYSQSRAEGRSKGQAAMDAGVYGASEALTEIPLLKLIGEGGKNIIESTIRGTALEGAGEGINQVTQDLYDAGVDPDRTIGQALQDPDEWGSIGMAMLAGGVMGGGLGAASGASRSALGQNEQTGDTPDATPAGNSLETETSDAEEASQGHGPGQRASVDDAVQGPEAEAPQQREAGGRPEQRAGHVGQPAPAEQPQLDAASEAPSTEGVSHSAARAPVDDAADTAAESPTNDTPTPTDAQKAAGNYKKGSVQLAGLNVAIENPHGSTRSGTDADGNRWRSKMHGHYGYVRGTEGNDGDAVDVFIKPGTRDADTAYVIDQHNDDGSFDEHKTVIGADSIDDARETYRANYPKGKAGDRTVTAMPMDQFKDWLKNGDLNQPAAPQRKAPPKSLKKADREARAREQQEATAQQATEQQSTDDTPPWRVPRAAFYRDPDHAGDDHEKAVRDALDRGERVPADVMVDYPELAESRAPEPPAEQGSGQEGQAAADDDGRAPGVEGQASSRGRQVSVGRGNKIDVQGDFVDAADLVASNTAQGNRNPSYPEALQPRDRSRVSGRAQVDQISRNIDPELLDDTAKASDGAPIVGHDNVVESGNGRVAAIRQAYDTGRGDSYRQFVQRKARREGADIAGMEQPVYVRRRSTPMDDDQRAEFARQANQSDVSQMSPAEQARTDASRLNDDDMALFDPGESGNVLARSNDAFLQRFAERTGDVENLRTGDGRWNKRMADRAQAAVFDKAYGDPRLLEAATEEADPAMRNVLSGLQQAAPAFARAGRDGDLDTAGKLTDAVELVRDARARGQDVGERLSQTDAFGEIDPDTAEIARLIDANKRSGKRLGLYFTRLGQLTEQYERQGADRLFGDTVTTGDIVNTAGQTDGIQQAEQADETTDIPGDTSTSDRGREPPGRQRTETDNAPATRSSPPKSLKRADQARATLGADVGDVVTPSENIGTSRAGTPYRIDAITQGGEVEITSTDSGGHGLWTRADLMRARNRGITFDKTSNEPGPEPGFSLDAQQAAPQPSEADPQPFADLLGDDTRNAQAVADETRRRDAKRSPGEDVPADLDGGLFARQTQDIEDTPLMSRAAKPQTETEAFKRWFGNSKVVNDDGSPRVVYHGTVGDFHSFDRGRLGENTQSTSSKDGFFFTSTERTARSYADYGATEARVERLRSEAQAADERGDDAAYDRLLDEADALEEQIQRPEGRMNGQNIMPAYLSIQNPLEIDARGETPEGIGGIDPLIRKAKARGHDGVIIRNFDDAAGLADEIADHYIVFRPEQIKSATGNRGTFSPDDPDILAARAYHGTPHRFDRFSLDAIGTGEGAQAFGWGLYFAGDREIADFYRSKLSRRNSGNSLTEDMQQLRIDGEPLLHRFPIESDRNIIEHVENGDRGSQFDRAAQQLETWNMLASDDSYPMQDYAADKADAWSGLLNAIRDGARLRSGGNGNLYQVDVPDASELMDWDAPLTEQPEAVQQALAEYDPDSYSEEGDDYDPTERGQSIYQRLVSTQGGDRAASQMLDQAGIPGLQYRDANSRTGSQDSRNYVIWDEDRVTVEAVNDELRQAAIQASRGSDSSYTQSDALSPEPTEQESADVETLQAALRQYLGRDDIKLRPAAGVSSESASTARGLAPLFGKRVAFFETADTDARYFNALALPGNSDVVYINANASTAHTALLGHELTHYIKRERPDLWVPLEQAAHRSLQNEPEYRDWLNRQMAAEGRRASDSLVREEMIADAVGDQFLKPSFWQQVMDRAPDRDVAQRIATVLRRFMDRVLDWLRQHGFGSSRYVSDMQRFRDAAADAFAGYASPEVAAAQNGAEMAASRAKPPAAFSPEPGVADRFRRDLKRTMGSLKTNVPPIEVTRMPSVLRALGIRDVPITISRDVVRKATNGASHDVPMSAIEQLPEELNDPLAVFESATQPGSLVALTEKRDATGRPVIVALDLRKRNGKYDVTRIASAYGRSNPRNAFSRWVSEGRLRYKSERADKSPVLKGLQLPNSVSGDVGPESSVLSERDVASRDGRPRASRSRAAPLNSLLRRDRETRAAQAEQEGATQSDEARYPNLQGAAGARRQDLRLLGRDNAGHTVAAGRVVDGRWQVVSHTGDMLGYTTETYASREAAEDAMRGQGLDVSLDAPRGPGGRQGEFQGNDLAAPERGYFGEIGQFLQYKAQDKFNALKRLQEAAEAQRGERLADQSDPYMAETLYHGQTRAAMDTFDENQVDPLLDALQKTGFRLNKLTDYADVPAEIAEQFGHLSAVDAYLYARHAPEANARLEEINPGESAMSGMSDEEASQIMDALEAKGEGQALADTADRVDAMTQGTRDLLVSSGLEKQETIDAWEGAYEHYVPLKGEPGGPDENASQRPAGTGRGFDVRGSASQRRLGRRSAAQNILANVVSGHYATIRRAEKNKVGRAMLRFAQEHPSPLWEVNQPMTKRGLDPVTGLVTNQPDPSQRQRDNVFIVRVNGVEHHIAFNENDAHAMRIASSLKNLGATDMGLFVKSLHWVNGKLSMLSTSLNPEFVISNFARDLQTAFVNLNDTDAAHLKRQIMKDAASGKSFRAIWNHQRGARDSEWAKYYGDFLADGASTGWMQGYDSIDQFAETLTKRLDREKPGSWPFAKRQGRNLMDFVEHTNTAVENSIRLSAYIHARENGLSRPRAAQMAKELTVNFNRKGEAGNALNAFYLFYNASVQGSARIIKAAATSPKARRYMTAAVATGVALDIANRMLAGTDDDGENRYDRIPDYVKQSNWIFMLPSNDSMPDWVPDWMQGPEGDYIKFPLPYGYNVLNYAGQKIGRAFSAATGELPDYHPGDEAAGLAMAALNAFNPIGASPSITQLVSPTITDPIVQWAENKNFAGLPIHPEASPFGPPPPAYTQHYSGVRPWSLWVTKELNMHTGGSAVRPGAVNVNPELLDHLWDFATGGVGRFAAETASLPSKVHDAVTGKADINAYEVPFVGKLYGTPRAGGSRDLYYDRSNEMRMLEQEYELARKDGDGQRRAELRQKFPNQTRVLGLYDDVSKQLRRLGREANKVDASKLSDGEKSQRLERIDDARERLYERFNRRYREVVVTPQS